MAEYNEKIAEQIIQEVETILNKHGYNCSIYEECGWCDTTEYNCCCRFDGYMVENNRYFYVSFGRDNIGEILLWDDNEKKFMTPIEIVVEIFNHVLYEYTDKYDGDKWE